MTKIDKSYLERLGEVLYDEKRVINYKTVSIMMGVHVNIAKQMLYHLHKTGKEEGKKVYATYYVSGMMPRRVMSSVGRQAGETVEESSSQQSDMDAYLVAICKEQDLEDLKAKYSKIFSVHMYSLSPFPIESCDVLASLVEFPLKDNEGRTPVDFGPIMCSASQKLKDDSDSILSTLSINDESKSKSNEVKKPASNGTMTKNESAVQEKAKDEQRKDSQETKSKLAKPSVPEKNGGRLKSMFATAASKPKPQPKKVDKPELDSEVKEAKKEKPAEAKKSQKSAKDKETRKRKRIRDVLSSDSEDEKMSMDEEDSLPETPAPRKRIQIESDSDDDFKQTPKKTKEPTVQNNEKNVAPGRKRVAKTISKTFIDKDGFLVTTKEQVMVSEDEDDEGQKESKKLDVELSKKSLNGSAKKSVESQTTKSGSTKNASGNSGKTKQPSLMSFFSKK